jgi:hypothetical protein
VDGGTPMMSPRAWTGLPAPRSALELTGAARAADVHCRDEIAAALLGRVRAKSVGTTRSPGWHEAVAGWLYVGADAAVFVADEPVFDRGRRGSNGERVVWLPYSTLGRADVRLSRWAADGRVQFADGTELTGGRAALSLLAKLAPGESWVVDVVRAPLRAMLAD